MLNMTSVAALKVETHGNGDNIPKAWTVAEAGLTYP